MIDYGEDKQTYGAPEIAVGPVSQLLTALYIGVFLFAFFASGTAAKFLPQINADLPGKFWTLVTGLFIFPESAGVYTGTPAGFWVIVTFLLIFFVIRPLELKAAGKGLFILFLLVFMLGPALVLWAIDMRSIEPVATWPFFFCAASGWAFWKFRGLKVKIGEKNFSRKWFFLIFAAVPVIFTACNALWSRCIIFLCCALLGWFWGVMEERKYGINISK